METLNRAAVNFFLCHFKTANFVVLINFLNQKIAIRFFEDRGVLEELWTICFRRTTK